MREGSMMSQVILGPIYENKQTKKLIHHIPKGSIAFLWHEDIDSVSASGLIEQGVKAIVNASTSMTGRYEHSNIEMLLSAGIHVFDVVCMMDKQKIFEGEEALIIQDKLYVKSFDGYEEIAAVASYDSQVVNQLKGLAKASYSYRFDDFITNTLDYAQKEKATFTLKKHLPEVFDRLEKQKVLIVARGGGYEKDLAYAKKLLNQADLIVIAVDGAADGLRKLGYQPDFIIGDMDSVSEESLQSGAALVCHSYEDGYSPGSTRLSSLGLSYQTLSLVGTSEDMAIQASYWSNADHIYLVGCRFGMRDYLEKGRPGMASSVLARIQAGDCLTDLKGIHKLEKNHLGTIVNRMKQLEDVLSEWIKKAADKKDWIRKKGAFHHE